MRTNNNYRTLADIFLMLLKQNAKDENFKAYVSKVKTLMKVPECAEYLSICLMNELGCPSPITASTIDKAFDYMAHLYEDSIEENKELTREQKSREKATMLNFMNQCKIVVMKFVANMGLLK